MSTWLPTTLTLDRLKSDPLTKYAVAAAACSLTAAGVVLGALHIKYGLRFRSSLQCPQSESEHDSAQKDVSQPNAKTLSLPSKFSFLSQNTWLVFFMGGRERRARIDVLVENIQKRQLEGCNLQFICLQECFIVAVGPWLMLSGDFEYLASKLAALGFKYHTDPRHSLPAFFGFNSGLVTFSSRPVQTYLHHEFISERYAPFVRRGCIQTIFRFIGDKGGEHELAIFNTHFENVLRKFKMDQMREVASVISKYVDDAKARGLETLNLICCGDFNICSNGTWELKLPVEDRMYRYLCETMATHGLDYDCVRPLEESGIERTYRQTKRDYQASYDHIFVNHNVKKRIDEIKIEDYRGSNGLWASDHYGLLVKFVTNK